MRGDNEEFPQAGINLRRVHPHMRGDNLYCAIRGNKIRRFTPTCVGTI